MRPSLRSIRRLAAGLAVAMLVTAVVNIASPVLRWVTDYGVRHEALVTHPVVASRAEPAGGAAAVSPSTPAAPAEGIAPTDPPAQPLDQVARATGRVETDQVATAHFTTVGVRLAQAPSSPVLVRWQGTAGWSDWHQLDVEGDVGPDRQSAEAEKAKSRPGVETEPLWVGDGSAYQVNLAGQSDGGHPEVLLVGETGRHLVAESRPATAGAATPNQPAIHPRSDWGAAAPTGTIDAAPDLKMAVVHHSDTGNNYTPAQVPGMIRAVQAFHIEGRDWSDIGYNFIVDRFGGIWEGRAGSINQLSIGAHAQGFNTSTVGVMVLGNYSTTGPSAAALDSVAKVIAWEFANHGVDPDSPVAYTSGGSLSIPAGETRTFPRIVGHRDVGATSCPGTFLYPQLPNVRALVDAKYPGAASPVGAVDVQSGGPGGIYVGGWAVDPSTPDPIEVHVYIDGVGTNLGPASLARADIGTLFPASGAPHGFAHAFGGLATGAHQVCVFAINAGPGENRLLSCSTVVVPTGSPVGAIDRVILGPDGTLTVDGWTLDPDTAAPIRVDAYVDGVGTTLGLTSVARGDVAGLYPLYGAQHGFTWSTKVAQTAHEVCLFGINVGPGSNTLLGCQRVTPPTGSPLGTIEVANGGPDGTATIAGWALDPDTTAPIRVDVYVDGVGRASGTTSVARPDVAAFFAGWGPTHGFVDQLTGLTPGTHQVCAYGINVGAGGNVLLRCASLTVPSGSPFGAIDNVVPAAGGGIAVGGWAIDPDTAGPIRIDAYVDGVGYASTMAAGSRPDVAAAFAGYGPGHGYLVGGGAVAPGAHQVCLYAINVGGGGNVLLGCRPVTT